MLKMNFMKTGEILLNLVILQQFLLIKARRKTPILLHTNKKSSATKKNNVLNIFAERIDPIPVQHPWEWRPQDPGCN